MTTTTPQPRCRWRQQQDTRYLVQNPPAEYLSGKELDEVYNLVFEREQHPFYAKNGSVKALETIRFSVCTHRGCYGEMQLLYDCRTSGENGQIAQQTINRP